MKVLEINDSGLLLSDADGQWLATSPGYVAHDGRQLLTGVDAMARSRIDPRRCNNRYWYQPEATLDRPLGDARSHADLAYAHLKSLQGLIGDAPLLVVVPGTFKRNQLALLLGVLKALNIETLALVDAAVAAASTQPAVERLLHLDVELHRHVLTVIEGADELAATSVIEAAKPGLTDVWDCTAAVLGNAFLRQARFDPMHSAATEQAVYDQMPAWLARFGEQSVAVLEVTIGGRTHRASVSRAELLAGYGARLSEVAIAVRAAVLPGRTRLLLSARAAAIPGLAAELERIAGLIPGLLDPLAPARGALAQQDRLANSASDAGLPYLTRLPRLHAAVAVAGTTATHLLIGQRAWPLPADASLALDTLVPGLSGQLQRQADGWSLNGVPLASGEEIDVGGQRLRLIEVLRP